MEIKYFGANCLKITTKKAALVIDDNLNEVGKKTITTGKEISIITNQGLKATTSGYFVVNSAGEYELSEVSIKGIPTKLHYDPEANSVMYSVHVNGFSIAILGHSVSNLTEEQLEEFGVVDILIVPVGGGGYTLDPVEAVKLIKTIEPKLVIPTHYQSSSISYEVPQLSLEDFVKSLGITDYETLDSIKYKENNLPEKTNLVVLSES